jgi:hypothetical protein
VDGQYDSFWNVGCPYTNSSGAATAGIAIDGTNLGNLTGIDLSGGSSSDHANGSDEESKGVHLVDEVVGYIVSESVFLKVEIESES